MITRKIDEDLLPDDGSTAFLEQICSRMGWEFEYNKTKDLIVYYPEKDKDMASWIFEI